MNTFQHPLSNAQIELLNLFTQPLSDDALLELKRLLLQFKFDQLEQLANAEWETKPLSTADLDERLHEHRRTVYRSQQRYLANE